MVEKSPKGVRGKTNLTLKEWRFLNRYSEPESPLWRKQLKTIDRLRIKYPDGSPAQEALNIFDPKTGVGARNADILSQALNLYHEGKIYEAEELMRQFKQLGD